MKTIDTESDKELHSVNQLKNTALENNVFTEAQAVVQNIDRQVIDFQNDPELNLLEKYKDYIWFALPKEIGQIQSSNTDSTGMFPAIAPKDTD